MQLAVSKFKPGDLVAVVAAYSDQWLVGKTGVIRERYYVPEPGWEDWELYFVDVDEAGLYLFHAPHLEPVRPVKMPWEREHALGR